MRILLLGGTAEAKQLAETLHRYGVLLVYSIAGLVRRPLTDFPVISGGFSQYGGLTQYISQQGINAIVDATHPYAQQISCKAVSAAKAMGIPCWRYIRPPWQAQERDHWFEWQDWPDLLPKIADKKALFITMGRVSPVRLQNLQAACSKDTCMLLRMAHPPDYTQQQHVDFIQDIGPFTLEAERALMQKYVIDALICKNSGGNAVAAKLQAAREQSIPVFMQIRPKLLGADIVFDDLNNFLQFLLAKPDLRI